MYCKNCGNKLNKKEKFCAKCGWKIIKRKKKKIIIIMVLLITMASLGVGEYFWYQKRQKNNSNITQEISYNYKEDGTVKFIDGKFSDKKIKSSGDALGALEDVKDLLGIKDIEKEFDLKNEATNNNTTYYRFKQKYNDIPVLYQDMIVSCDRSGNALSVNGYYEKDINIDTKPKLSTKDSEKIALEKIGDKGKVLTNELSILPDDDKDYLVYNVLAISDDKAEIYLIDANTGDILSKSKALDYADYKYAGVGLDDKTYTITLDYNAGKYEFYDHNRNISIHDYRNTGSFTAHVASNIPTSPIYLEIDAMNGNITSLNGISEYDPEFLQNAITTMAQFEKIYDYYLNVLNRDSYDGAGSEIKVNIGVTALNFTNIDLNNAFWSNFSKQMYIGNYYGKSLSASLDVMAHEFTHGVNKYIIDFASSPKLSKLNKAFEPGALNEGIADIFGHLIEGNWDLGENNPSPKKSMLRTAIEPTKYGQAAIKGGENYIPDGYDKESLKKLLDSDGAMFVSDYDNGGVHQNAGVVTHAAYLMYDAGAFKDMEEMAKVWYDALFLMPSYASFEDCALAVIMSAEKYNLSDTSLYKITKAFIDTKMMENKSYTLKGKVINGRTKIKDAIIEVYSLEDNRKIAAMSTNNKGEYHTTLPVGEYQINIKKDNYLPVSKKVVIKGDTTLDVSLKDNKSSKVNKAQELSKECPTDSCYSLNVYYLDFNKETNRVEEVKESYAVVPNTIYDIDAVLEEINAEDMGSVTTDGESFYFSFLGYTLECAFYYKDTDKKFNWTKPINEDVDIELKLFNGSFGNDTITDIYDLFGM